MRYWGRFVVTEFPNYFAISYKLDLGPLNLLLWAKVSSELMDGYIMRLLALKCLDAYSLTLGPVSKPLVLFSLGIDDPIRPQSYPQVCINQLCV